MIHLSDWLTTPQIPIASKITDTKDWFLHDHSFFEIFYIIDGSIQHIINGNTKETLYAGDLYFLKPTDTHAFVRTEDNKCKHRDIIFRKQFFKLICNYISPDLYNDFINDKLDKKLHISAYKISEFENAFETISKIPTTKPELILASARSISAEMFGLLVSASIEKHLCYPKWLQELLQKFNDSSLVVGGLDAIIEGLFYTKEHVCRTFKKLIGMTMTEYLNTKRLEIAADMLTYTPQQIIKISNDLGFASVSYFNKIFKQKYGLTPMEFKRNATHSNKE